MSGVVQVRKAPPALKRGPAWSAGTIEPNQPAPSVDCERHYFALSATRDNARLSSERLQHKCFVIEQQTHPVGPDGCSQREQRCHDRYAEQSRANTRPGVEKSLHDKDHERREQQPPTATDREKARCDLDWFRFSHEPLFGARCRELQQSNEPAQAKESALRAYIANAARSGAARASSRRRNVSDVDVRPLPRAARLKVAVALARLWG